MEIEWEQHALADFSNLFIVYYYKAALNPAIYDENKHLVTTVSFVSFETYVGGFFFEWNGKPRKLLKQSIKKRYLYISHKYHRKGGHKYFYSFFVYYTTFPQISHRSFYYHTVSVDF